MPLGVESDGNSRTVTNDDLKFTISTNLIESRALGHSVFDLTDFVILSPGPSSRELYKLIEKQVVMLGGLEGGLALVQCRESLDKKLALEMLQSVGFQFRELTQHPILHRKALEKNNHLRYSSHFKAREVMNSKELVSLALEYMKAFEIGRFYGDSRVSREIIEERFHTWIKSGYKRNDKKLITVEDISGNHVGLFLLRLEENGSVFWELTALHSSITSKGKAKEVFAFMVGKSFQDGDTIESNFSSENTKLFKIYLDLGFRLKTPSVALHLWLG